MGLSAGPRRLAPSPLGVVPADRLNCSTKHAPVAQLDRATVFGTVGWGFEPLRAHCLSASRHGDCGPADHPADSERVDVSLPPLSSHRCAWRRGSASGRHRDGAGVGSADPRASPRLPGVSACVALRPVGRRGVPVRCVRLFHPRQDRQRRRDVPPRPLVTPVPLRRQARSDSISGAALSSVSWYSAAGLESPTMPPPTEKSTRPVSASSRSMRRVRMAMLKHADTPPPPR